MSRVKVDANNTHEGKEEMTLIIGKGFELGLHIGSVYVRCGTFSCFYSAREGLTVG